jgi:hypothetical protein
MAMGKPVLCYLREADFGNVPAAMIADLPIRNIRPDHLAQDIAAALDRRSEWPEWSAKSRRYVEKWHDPAMIAANMVEAYKNPSAAFDCTAGGGGSRRGAGNKPKSSQRIPEHPAILPS